MSVADIRKPPQIYSVPPAKHKTLAVLIVLRHDAAPSSINKRHDI
jgi:hypothetical protein